MEISKIMEWIKANKYQLVIGGIVLLIVAIGTYQWVTATLPAPKVDDTAPIGPPETIKEEAKPADTTTTVHGKTLPTNIMSGKEMANKTTISGKVNTNMVMRKTMDEAKTFVG